MKNCISAIVNEAIGGGVFPGCVVGIVSRGGLEEISAFGRYTFEPDSLPLKEISLFDVASVTKSIPTASIALKALEEGKIKLDDPIVTWVPELDNNYREKICIRHLLTHTVDFDLQLSSLKDSSPEEILFGIFHARVRQEPGTSFSYCNSSSILVSMIMQRVYGMSLDSLAGEFFFGPLGMKDTTFFPSAQNKAEIVPTEIDPWRGRIIQGEVHDESAWVLSQNMIPGSAGLFSTVPDLLVFLQMLINYGSFDGKVIFLPETVKSMARNQWPGTSWCAGLGWELNQTRFMGEACSGATIGKTGFTGCSVLADLERGIGVVFLSNYTYPKRKESADQINTVRRSLHEAIFRTYA